jgi:hypothetical protein
MYIKRKPEGAKPTYDAFAELGIPSLAAILSLKKLG